MKTFIIHDFYFAYISKNYNKGALHAFTRNQPDILVFASESEAREFIKKKMKHYPFDDLEIAKSHF